MDLTAALDRLEQIAARSPEAPMPGAVALPLDVPDTLDQPYLDVFASYDDDDLRRCCGEHISDPHAYGCPAGDVA